MQARKFNSFLNKSKKNANHFLRLLIN